MSSKLKVTVSPRLPKILSVLFALVDTPPFQYGRAQEICCFRSFLAFLLFDLSTALEGLMRCACVPWHIASTHPTSGISCFVASPTSQLVIEVICPKGFSRTGFFHEAVGFWAHLSPPSSPTDDSVPTCRLTHSHFLLWGEKNPSQSYH